jgi:Tol biopolymer transport system component
MSILNAPEASAQTEAADSPGFVAYNSEYHDTIKSALVFDFATGISTVAHTPDVAEQTHPSISAGGRSIAFDAYCDFGTCGCTVGCGGKDIFLFDFATSSLVPLPGLNSPYQDADPTISAGGRYIAFSSDRAGTYDIYLYDRETASLVPLPGLNSDIFGEGEPALGSNATLIAFHSNRAGGGNIYLYDRTTPALVKMPGLNSASSPDVAPALSSDGNFMAFESYRNGQGDVFLYDRTVSALVPLPGLNKRRLGHASFDGQPSLSKTGRFIAFSSLRNDADDDDCVEEGDCHDWDIFIYDRSTSQLTQPPIPDISNRGEVHPSLR